MNCALGAKDLRPYIDALSRVADAPVVCYPNAGLPNEFGEYDEPPEKTAEHLRGWAEAGLVNFVGGCCGTTPEHLKAIIEALQDFKPRVPQSRKATLHLSGLEPLEVDDRKGQLMMVGERTNVMG